MNRGGEAPEPERIAEQLSGRIAMQPDVFIVLGSGLGAIEQSVEDAVSVPFQAIRGMPRPSVKGHAGRFVMGSIGGVSVLLQSGRFHAYEGHGMDTVALPVRVAACLGASTLVATNAAGGIREDLGPGRLVRIEDHLNLMLGNPLAGSVVEGEARFPDMSEPYDRALGVLAANVAERLGISLDRGVYAAVLGPSYETAAEVRMLARLGADLVGMSTVPEVITARARGMRCLAFSMVTNRAAGLSDAPLSHDDVLEVGARAGGRLADLVSGVMAELGRISAGPDDHEGRAK
ncbi:MAG: purine-nucleoside phosphorylase [Gemmatimonadota bacterium]